MELKPRLKVMLEFSRSATKGLLKVFQTPEDWTHQICPGGNHAMWIMGHLAWVDNSFLKTIRADADRIDFGDLKSKFSVKSEPSNKPADYPPASEILALFRDRRIALMTALDRFSEDDLKQPCLPGGPSSLTDVASVFEMIIWHEGMHAGQLTMIRRALGHPPAFA